MRGIPWWVNLAFVFVGLVLVYAIGAMLSFIVGAVNPQIPAAVTGALLCPPDTQPRAPYVRSFGGVSGPMLICEDANGTTVASSSLGFNLIWTGLFVAPLLPIVFPIVRWLRQHNYPLQPRRRF